MKTIKLMVSELKHFEYIMHVTITKIERTFLPNVVLVTYSY